MPRRKKDAEHPTIQTAIRIPPEWVGRLHTLAEALSLPGLSLTSSDAMRMALARGMDELEAERGLEAKRPRKAASAS